MSPFTLGLLIKKDEWALVRDHSSELGLIRLIGDDRLMQVSFSFARL